MNNSRVVSQELVNFALQVICESCQRGWKEGGDKQTDGWMDGRGFIRNSNRGRQVKRNNEKKKYVYTRYRKKLKKSGGIKKNKLKVVQNQHNVLWKVKRWTHTGNGPERQKCNKPACGQKEQHGRGGTLGYSKHILRRPEKGGRGIKG